MPLPEPWRRGEARSRSIGYRRASRCHATHSMPRSSFRRWGCCLRRTSQTEKIRQKREKKRHGCHPRSHPYRGGERMTRPLAPDRTLKKDCMMRMNGKVAVVTGASSGIGAGIAKAFGAEGATVVVNYANGKDKADAVVAA